MRQEVRRGLCRNLGDHADSPKTDKCPFLGCNASIFRICARWRRDYYLFLFARDVTFRSTLKKLFSFKHDRSFGCQRD